FEFVILFFFITLPSTDIYTLSLHDALPIYHVSIALFTGGNKLLLAVELVHKLCDVLEAGQCIVTFDPEFFGHGVNQLGSNDRLGDRKSTRLNSSHSQISYAVFCLKKKNKQYSDAGSEDDGFIGDDLPCKSPDNNLNHV